ncbi:MAG: Holliday junction branch migration protein RuvA [Clostridia bacterium]|nr:Holliday junction branch migration protein RuvA [Clostridia bacterium]
MFAYIEGTVAGKGLNEIVLDVMGVGWQVTCSANTVMKAPRGGETMRLYTVLSVREDGVELYGFSSLEEKAMFRRLTGVSGIGPKSAIGILGSLSLKDLTRAIMEGDVSALSRAQGVGKKTAQRMALELKGKVTDDELRQILGDEEAAAVQLSQKPDASSEVMVALQNLGYSAQEARDALARIPVRPEEPSELLRLALKNMG